jgi:alkylhydroperoxidase family enzyme
VSGENVRFIRIRKAGLLWAENLTALNGKEISDEVYSKVSFHFSETEMVDLNAISSLRSTTELILHSVQM